MEMQRGVRCKPALFIHLQRDGGNFEQRIGFSVKSGCFYINDNGIKTTKTVAQTAKLSVIGHQGLLQGEKAERIMANFAG